MFESPKSRSRAALVVVSLGGLLALTGCSAGGSTNDGSYGAYTNDGSSQTSGAESGASTAPSDHYTFWQKLPGGKRVLCAYADDNADGGGLSCDWEHEQTVPSNN